MKFVSKCAVYGIALAVTSLVLSAQAQQQQGEAQVLSVKGSAQYSEGGGAWMPLKAKDVLKVGSTVKTDAGSQVDLSLKQNGKLVRIMENTLLALTRMNFEQTGGETTIDTEIGLNSGRVVGTVKKLSEPSRYIVRTPANVVSIRGTDYDISYPGATHIRDGTAGVRYITPSGKAFDKMVGDGETWMPPAQPEGEPTVVPTPPDYVWPLPSAPGEPLEKPVPPVIEKPISPLTGEGPAPTKPSE